MGVFCSVIGTHNIYNLVFEVVCVDMLWLSILCLLTLSPQKKKTPPKRNLEDNNVARHLMYLHLKRVGFLISVVSCQRVGEGRGLREMI